MGAELVWAAIDAMGVVVVRHLARFALFALAVLASTVGITDIATAVVSVRLLARVACYTSHSVRRILLPSARLARTSRRLRRSVRPYGHRFVAGIAGFTPPRSWSLRRLACRAACTLSFGGIGLFAVLTKCARAAGAIFSSWTALAAALVLVRLFTVWARVAVLTSSGGTSHARASEAVITVAALRLVLARVRLAKILRIRASCASVPANTIARETSFYAGVVMAGAAILARVRACAHKGSVLASGTREAVVTSAGHGVDSVDTCAVRLQRPVLVDAVFAVVSVAIAVVGIGFTVCAVEATCATVARVPQIG